MVWVDNVEFVVVGHVVVDRIRVYTELDIIGSKTGNV